MIFVCEDDENILNLVLYGLETAAFSACGFSTSSALLAALERDEPQCIILDIMLPGKSGIEVLSHLRTHHKYKDIPVIILSALGAEIDIIKGLDNGADDYITKPFSMLELIARVKARLRGRTKPNSNITFQTLIYSQDTHNVSIDGQDIKLTLKEFTLLGLFLESFNRIFTREELLETIWGYNITGTRTVDIHINTLRSKLGRYGANIVSIRGVGYTFRA